MIWNPFKRIAVLEKRIADLNDELVMQSQILHDLNVKHKALHKWVANNPYAAAPVRSEGKLVFTMSEVEQERERNRQYQRERYAIKKNDKAAREKKNAYARAYYARTKGAKK